MPWIVYIHKLMPTCISTQQFLSGLLEVTPGQVIGIVEVMSIATEGPPSRMLSFDGAFKWIPRKKGGLSNSFVLLPITSCLDLAEHCT